MSNIQRKLKIDYENRKSDFKTLAEEKKKSGNRKSGFKTLAEEKRIAGKKSGFKTLAEEKMWQ